MDPLIANIAGIIGSVLIVAAYGYANMAKAVRWLPYNIVNFMGAALLTASLIVHFNLAALLLEIVWMGIALYGIWKAMKDRRSEG